MINIRCEPWYLAPRKEQNLKVFEKRVMRKTFGTKCEKVTGGWRKFIMRILHQIWLQRSTKEDEKERTRNTLGEEINAYKILLEKPEGRRPNRGLKCGWEFKEIRCRLDTIGSEKGPVAESSEPCD
jgi:hypothetical protein